VFFFGLAPGDDLLCTAVLRELRKRGLSNFWMMSSHPELFEGMSDAARIVPVSDRYRTLAKIYKREIRILEYAPWEKDQSVPPSRHIIAELCACAGVTGPITLKPYLALSEIEKLEGAWASTFIAVQSSGLASKLPMKNKEWLPQRFQELVDVLSSEFKFVQLGSALDPPLRGAKDLRGATSIRQLAAILHHARLYVGNVGFLMHLARAVECPSVIVYGGREAPWQSGYTCNINLFSAIACAPCWRWNTCDFNRKCMLDITTDQVVQGVRTLLSRQRNPLVSDQVSI
jgi:ADP-heptose:LPS heptosyltransferase